MEMELLDKNAIATELGISPFTIQKWIARRKLPGQLVGRTWITTQEELDNYQEVIRLRQLIYEADNDREVIGEEDTNKIMGDLQSQIHQIEKVKTISLYDTPGAAAYMDISVYSIGRLIKLNELSYQIIDKRGVEGGTRAFQEEDLDRVKTDKALMKSLKPGPEVKGDPDRFIEMRVVKRWYVLGTKDRNGNPLSYAFQFDARAKARIAFEDNDLKYHKGDHVFVKKTQEHPGFRATIVEDVTVLDQTAFVIADPSNDDPNKTYIPTDIIIPIKEIQEMAGEIVE